MSKKHHPKDHPLSNTREHKKAQFSKPTQQQGTASRVLLIALITLIAVAVYLVVSSTSDRPESRAVTVASQSTTQKTSTPEGRDIIIPISDVSSGKAKFFDYSASDRSAVRFFVIRSSDGVYRAALDACDVCFAAKKGYYQEGDNMVCRKCSRQFPSALVNEVSGGCNPVPVTRAVDGDKLIIKASELESRKSYF